MQKLFGRFKKLIITTLIASFCVSVLFSVAAYLYISKNQEYESTVNIKFINDGAKNGYAYDGTLNSEVIKEIKNVEILEPAVKRSGTELSTDELYAALTITEVIPQDEQDKIASALDNGNEYVYFPVEYSISLKTDDEKSDSILNYIVEGFIDYYGRKHIQENTMPSSASKVYSENYDYIENAKILFDNINSQMYYIEPYVDNGFRSSSTGASFKDIYEEYGFLSKTYIPKIYAEVLNRKISKNPALLLEKLRNENVNNAKQNENAEADIEKLLFLIKTYSEKNKANGIVEDGFGDAEIDENRKYVLDDVYENASRPQTQYDELFTKYSSESDGIKINEITEEYNNNLIEIFSGEDVKSVASDKNVDAMLDTLVGKLDELYKKTNTCIKENNNVMTSSIIRVLNTPDSAPVINKKLYLVIAFAAGFMLTMIAVPLLHNFFSKLNTWLDSGK